MAQIRCFSEYDFRDHYRDCYAETGETYHRYESAYRYGYDLAYGYRYRNRSWAAVEKDVRLDWERRHPDQRWEDVRDAVCYSWETVHRTLEMRDPAEKSVRR